MNRFLTTTAMSLALVSGPALADDTDIEQILGGVQDALNILTFDADGGNLSQTATNAGNLIEVGENLDDVFQDVDDMTQTATNFLFSFSGAPDPLDMIDQDATNVLNTMAMESGAVEDIDQDVNDALQQAQNDLFFDSDTANVTQDAVNAANLISLEGVELEDTASQLFQDSDQWANNIAEGDDFSDDLDNIAQTGTNVANMFSMGDIDDLDQTFDTSVQDVTNEIIVFDDVNSKDPANVSSQTAVNAANIASVTRADMVVQTVNVGEQLIFNNVDGLSPGDDLTNMTQQGTNVANALSDTNGNPGAIDVVSQSADDLFQEVDNIIDAGGVNSAVEQTATNAANIATIADLDTSFSQNFVNDGGTPGFAQRAYNELAFGGMDASVSDLTQAATNVVNSLTGEDIDGSVSQSADMFFDNEDQLAENFVTFGTGGISGSQQAATNALNMISADRLQGQTTQWTDNPDQDATNTMLSLWGGSVVGIDGTDQAATNALNVITTVGLPDLNGVQDVSQTVIFGQQFATNTLTTSGSVFDFAQAATNVANSISLPTPAAP